MAENRTGQAIALVVADSVGATWTVLTGEPSGQLGIEVTSVLYASGSYDTTWTLHRGDLDNSGSIGGIFASGSFDGHLRPSKYHQPPLRPSTTSFDGRGRYTSPVSGSYCLLMDGQGTLFHTQASVGANHLAGGAVITAVDPPIVATYPIRYFDSDTHNRIVIFGTAL